MESNSSKCKKFSANIFNKSKCQNCFRPKEQHSAEALESCKVLRKVSKCGYLFVAPESFDFNNPMDKTRRWQRRFFVLYDDGELTYSVDENVGTVPQGVIDMNKCNDVHDAETVTSHPLAIAVRTPDKTTFIKGSDKHEIERWFDVLVMYPRSLKTKHRRSPTYPANTRPPALPAPSPAQPAPAPDPPPAARRPASQSLVSGAIPVTRPTNLPGINLPSRRHTYTYPPTWTPEDDDDAVCLTSLGDVSLPIDLFPADSAPGAGSSTEQQEVPGESASGSFSRSRIDTRMADQSAVVAPSPQRPVLENVPATYRSVRRMKQRDRAYQEGMHRDRSSVYQEGMRKSNSMHDLSRADADTEPTDPPLYRSRSRDALYASPPQTRPVSERLASSAPTSPASTRPKTFFESLHEDFTNPPEPPKPKPKNNRYLRLASIPKTRPIDDYDPSDPEPDPDYGLSPRRSKSLDRSPTKERRPTSPSPVSANRQPLRSQSSPRVRPSPSSSANSHIQRLRDKFQNMASQSVPALVPNFARSRSSSHNSCVAELTGTGETTIAKGSTGSGHQATLWGGTSVSTLTQQWSNHSQDGNYGKNLSTSTRTGRSPVRRLHMVSRPTTIHNNLTSSSSPQHALGVETTHVPAHVHSKFTVRVPPPYRTASLSTAPSYSMPRTPLIVQDSSQDATGSRTLPRSVSAPACAKVGAESTRSSGRAALDVYGTRDSGTPAYIVNGRTKNETDEHKMAKSGEFAARIGHHLATDSTTKQRHDPYDDLMYMKKGWLLKQHQDQDWSKHWFVLSGSSLRFYKDSRAEETSDEDGCIDIASCYEVGDTSVSRNYGFKLKTSQGDHILSAMTSGIRNNWMQAVQKCMETSGHAVPHLDFNPAHRDYSPGHRDYNSTAHRDYSPASSTRTSSYSSVSRSSSRHSDYGNSQREVTPRHHTVNVTSNQSARGVFTGETAALALSSPRSDHSETAYSRPSRARRSLNGTKFSEGGEGQKVSMADLQHLPPQSAAARFVSCTWPYDSSSSGASGSEREHTPDSSSHGSHSRRNSNVSQYLEDEEEVRSHERTAEEEQELDDVEHNIRRIHRRSLSDHSSRQKPPHFDKFESGSAFDSSDQPGSGRSSSATTPTRRHPPSEHSTPIRAPSAKVKEKSRARSPRPRSPPPLEVKARDLPMDDATPLLQVESLKNQLERTRTELTDSKHENHTLKLQLRTNNRDQDDLITDLETDKTRYLTQIEDIQDQMEHTTDFLQQRLVEQEAKLAEQESHADLTKLQVQTLKKHLKEAKDKMEAQETQLKVVQSKLKTESTAQALRDVTMQKEHFEKTCKELERKLKLLEEEVEQLELQLGQKTQQLSQREERLESVQEALEHSEQNILDLEHELEEMHTLQAEVKLREDKLADLEEELSAVRSQLHEQDQELAVKDDIHKAETHHLEEKRAMERTKLEDHLEELEKQLEVTRRQSTMSDSLNSNMADILREKDETIAQLEEKLIENDSKIEELTEEVALEMEENTQLQLNLEASYGETAHSKRDVEHLSGEIARMEKALDEARDEADELKRVEEKQRGRIEEARQEQLTLKEQVDALQRENSELRHVLEEMKQLQVESQQLTELTREVEEHKCQNDAFKEECAKLEREMGAANEKVTQYESELTELKRQHENDLEERYRELIEARQMTAELQTQLALAEEAVMKNKQLLEEKMAAMQPCATPSTGELESQYKELEKDYEDLKTKYERSMHEVRRLRNELREAHISIDDMEISSTGVKQQIKAMEADHQQQLALMSSRVQDLTSKLAMADKKVRKLERRASRRESKLKLRRDSLESGEKTSGSSGEAEHERESDIRAPDQEVMDLLKAVVGSPPAQPVSAFNTSRSSNNSNLEDSISTEVSKLDLGQGDLGLAARCKQLQDGLVTSEAKVKELSKALNLITPEGQSKELQEVQEQNKKYQQQIIFLTAKLNKSSAAASVEAAKAKRAANRDEQASKTSKDPERDNSNHAGSESKLSHHTQSTLDEMQQKLTEVVDELGSMQTTPSTADYTTTISGLRSRLETILTEISGTAGEGKIAPRSVSMLSAGQSLKVNDPVRMFAEKLSLEAMLVSEMAHLIRNGQEPIMSERQVYLHEIAAANHRILELEQKVESLQLHDSGKREGSGGIVTGDPLMRCSGLLAEKMVLQSHMQTLVEKYKDQMNISSTPGKTVRDGTTASMGQEALLKSQLSERLQGQNRMSLMSRVLVHGEFTFIMNKLRERMADSHTDQERIDLLDHELELSHQRLCERANLMCDGVEAFKMAVLDKVAATIVNNKASKNGVDAQMAGMIQKCAAEYRKQSVDAEHLGVMSESIPESRRHAMIEASIQQEVEEAMEVLAERCEGVQLGEGVGGETELNAVLESVCEVLAQKAVIDGHIAYITEQIQQHQQQEPADGRALNPLRRHDSGIIVGGSSMPTSPTVEEDSPMSSTDGDTTSLAGRLTREAAAKKQLALSLQRKDGTPDSIQQQMTKIAADLVSVDVDLGQHRRLISDYTEVIAQEAMFQAQMTYLTEQLRMQHEQQITELQRQLDTRSPGVSTMDEQQQVQVLEAEIHRLSELLQHNDEMLQREAANAGQRMAQLEEELQRQEDFFQTEVTALEQRYKDRLKVAEVELRETQEQLEKLQVSTQEEVRSYTEKVRDLEHQLEKAHTALTEARSKKSGPSAALQQRVLEVEEKLEVAHKSIEVAERKHSQQLEVYSTKVANLEAQIVTISEKHAEEMAQAQEELKAAVVATGAVDLQKEVAHLKGCLDQERAEHQRQIEKLRLKPSEEEGVTSAEASAEGVQSAKVRHLEWQIENMQADYEHELTVQRTAHRRELTRSKEDLLGLLAQAEAKSMQIDEHTIRKRYTKEIEHIKEIYDCGFAAMEKSHQRVLREMRATHKRDLETLRSEKDQLLVEETKATQAALDAMRKAHEAEVQKERNKFLDAISKTYSNNDVDSIQRQHEEDLEMIQNEIRQLSEQLSIKCLENAALDERLTVQTSALAETRSRAHELMARNEELSLRLRQDIERLSKMIKQPAAPGSPFRRQGEPPEVYDLRVALKVKDVDKQQLQEEIAALRSQLHGTTEELEDSMERYQELHTEQTRMRSGYEVEIHKLRQRLDDVMDEPGSSSDGALSERERASAGSPDSAGMEDQQTDTSTITPESSYDGDQSPQFVSPRLIPSSGRALPQVSNEARNVKRFLWRQRHVQRARSTPGPTSMIRRLSLPVDQSNTEPAALKAKVTASSPLAAPSERPRRERSNRHTTMGINVTKQSVPKK